MAGPPEPAAQALRHVAADPKTISPMRVAEAGLWWNEQQTSEPDEDLREMEKALLAFDLRTQTTDDPAVA